MQEEVREVIEEYSGIGLVMVLFTTVIRPFVSIRQSIRDSAIVFIFTILAGVTLEGLDISPYFKLGFSGLCGFWAVRLYEICLALLMHIKDNPEKIIAKLDRQ